MAGVGRERAPDLARAIARRERGAARAALAARSDGPANSAGAVSVAIAEIVERGSPRDAATLGVRGASALASLEGLRQELALLEPTVQVTIDLAEFADFANLPGDSGARDYRPYYDGLVWRAYLPGRARPVANGGRYDALFRKLGAEVAAIGFSIRLDALAELDLEEDRR